MFRCFGIAAYIGVGIAVLCTMPQIVFAVTATTTVLVVPPAECNDTLDNDGDTFTDYPDDPGCTSTTDDDEVDPIPACIDGADNDGDTNIDFPDDLGCASTTDDDESDDPDEDNVSEGQDIGFETRRVIFSGAGHPRGDVVILFDGEIRTVASADAEGNFEVNLGRITPGSYLVTLFGLDSTGQRSGPLAFTLETVRGASTFVSSLFLPPTIIANNRTISGIAAPGSVVHLELDHDGEEFYTATTTAREAGAYVFDVGNIPLLAGVYTARTLAEIPGAQSPFGIAHRLVFGGVAAPTVSLRGDFNNDHTVGLVDFSIAMFWYNKENPPPHIDVNNDGVVDLADISIMAFHWTG